MLLNSSQNWVFLVLSTEKKNSLWLLQCEARVGAPPSVSTALSQAHRLLLVAVITARSSPWDSAIEDRWQPGHLWPGQSASVDIYYFASAWSWPYVPLWVVNLHRKNVFLLPPRAISSWASYLSLGHVLNSTIRIIIIFLIHAIT